MKNKLVSQWFEILIVVGLIVGFTLANALHIILPWLSNRPGFIFTGIAHYFADYFLYVDIMAQGAAGSLSAFPHFTNEILPASALYWYNTLIGWIGHLVGLSPFAGYNVALIMLMVVLCFLWYVLIREIYPTNRLIRITGFVFILSASNFIDLNGFFFAGRLDLIGQLWLSPSPALNRLGGVPHQVLQTILLLLLIIVFSKLLRRFVVAGQSQEWRMHSLFFILIAFLTATVNPIQVVLLIVAAGLTTLWYLRKSNKLLPVIMPFSVLLLSVIPGLLISYQWFLHPVFAAAKIWEAARLQIIPLWDMLLSIGPVTLLAPFGIIPFLRKATPIRMLIFLYGFGSYVAFYTPAYQIIGSANPRWLSPAPHAIWAILAAQGVFTISKWFSDKWSIKTERLKVLKKNTALLIVYCLLFIVYFIFTLPALYSQLDMRTNPKLNPILSSDLNHVPKPVVEALAWLKNQPDPLVSNLASQGQALRSYSNVVLTDPVLPYDVLVPVFTGKISFTGHPIHTLYLGVKESLRQQFFGGSMSEGETKKFLIEHRIGWIISSKNTIPYTINAFTNEAFSVFRVSAM